MRGDIGPNGSGPAHRSPETEDLSESVINRKLLSKAVSNRWTVYPLALVILAIVGLAVFPKSSDGSQWTVLSLVILLVAAAVSLSSFFWRNYLRHEGEYHREVQERMARQERQHIQERKWELTRLRDELHAGFSRLGSEEGQRALGDLVYEYGQIEEYRTPRRPAPRPGFVFVYSPETNRPNAADDSDKEPESASVAHIFTLAEETYRQGLTVLAAALRLMQAIHSSNTDGLRMEIADLEKEIERLRGDDAGAARLMITEATIDSHRERLGLLDEQRLRVAELMYQADRCEASLARTRIELAGLHTGSSENRVGAVTETLQKTIDQAKEVQAELKRLGF